MNSASACTQKDTLADLLRNQVAAENTTKDKIAKAVVDDKAVTLERNRSILKQVDDAMEVDEVPSVVNSIKEKKRTNTRGRKLRSEMKIRDSGFVGSDNVEEVAE